MSRIFLTICVVTSILFSFACVDKSGNTTTTNNGGGDTIKVGAFGDTSGATSSFGQSTKNGIQLAFDEINTAGGVNGKKLKCCLKTTKESPNRQKPLFPN